MADFDKLHAFAKRSRRRVVCMLCTSADDCPICLEPLRGQPALIAPCGHVWHVRCHRKLHDARRCVLCRGPMGSGSDVTALLRRLRLLIAEISA